MIACADIPSFPLQIALVENPTWRPDPTVIVTEHSPRAEILWINQHALSLRIHRGMRFGQAQALTARLKAAVVPHDRIQQETQKIFADLLNFSPHIEPSDRWPGLFWIDPTGLETVFGSLEDWAAALHHHLEDLGFVASVIVGTKRYTTFAIARSTTGSFVLRDPQMETRRAKKVPLTRLGISAKLCVEMEVLGVNTLGDFMRLPGHELRIRYGEEAEDLHNLASGKSWTPLQPQELTEPLRTELEVHPPDDNRTRLLFGIKSKLHEMVRTLSERCEALTALALELHLEHATAHTEYIETAGPTLDVVQLADLIRLRLDTVDLVAAVERIDITAHSVRVHPQQISLLQAKQRDLQAATRAIARIRAIFGRDAVSQAVLRDAILPEAKYAWDTHIQLKHPNPRYAPQRPLVQEVLRTPTPLPDIPQHEPERWLGNHGAVVHMHGAYRIQGGWWRRAVKRDYYYVETKAGELLWLYYDGPRRRWVIHGFVA